MTTVLVIVTVVGVFFFVFCSIWNYRINVVHKARMAALNACLAKAKLEIKQGNSGSQSYYEPVDNGPSWGRMQWQLRKRKPEDFYPWLKQEK